MRLTSVCVALAVLCTGATGRAADAKLDEAAKIIDASLRNIPDLVAVRVTAAREHPKKKGVVVLRGTVPNEAARREVETRLPGILKNARDGGSISGEFATDASRLVDQSLSRDDQIASVVRSALADNDPPAGARASVVSTRAAADGVVRLAGWVAKEKWRTVVEQEAGRALTEAVVMKEISGPLKQAVATDLYRAPNELFRVIESSIKNKDTQSLREARLLYGEATPEGKYTVYALVTDEAARQLLIGELRQVLKSAGGKSAELDPIGILVGQGEAAELRLFELIPLTKSSDYLVIGGFDRGKLRVAGFTETDALSAVVIDQFERFINITSVEVDCVIGPAGRDRANMPSLSAVSAALEKGDGERLIEYGTSWVRAGNGTHQTARDGWIMRATGHIQLGEWEQAAATVRAATYLEKQFQNPHYALTIPHYQGVGRGVLDTFYRRADELVVGNKPRSEATVLLERAQAAVVRERSFSYPTPARRPPTPFELPGGASLWCLPCWW